MLLWRTSVLLQALQALLVVQVVSTAAQDAPTMTLNSVSYPNGSEAELVAGSAFTLRCQGNGSSVWSSSAFLLRYRDNWGDTLTVQRSEPRHTGTYHCRGSWIHLYIRDPADPASVFVVPKKVPTAQEGLDFLLECRVTDPSVGRLALRREGPPLGQRVTFDPRRGAVIRDVRLADRGLYVCSALKDGRELTSATLMLLVKPRLLGPPMVSISQEVFIRAVGESLDITCQSSNPDPRYSLTWTHTHLQGLNVTNQRGRLIDQRYHQNYTVSLPVVQKHHAGTFTCSASNPAGIAMATASLTVVDAPYLRVYLQPAHHANVSTLVVDANRSYVAANGSTLVVDANRSYVAANGSTLVVDASANRSYVAANASTLVEVWAGRDVELSYLTEAYPPLARHHWTTPTGGNAHRLTTPTEGNASIQLSVYSKPDVLVSSLLLRRVNQEDEGTYTFFFSSPLLSGSQTIDLRVYRPPKAVIRLTGDRTVTCSSSGYPLPSVRWLTCPGLSLTCGDNATYQLTEADQSEEAEALTEEVQRELTLPSNTDDVTVECVATSQSGVSRVTYVSYSTDRSRQDTPPVFFNSLLIGSSGSAVLLLLLLLAVLYKYKQKPRYEIRWKIIDGNQGNHYSFIDPTQLPYNKLKWEFPREQLRLGLVVGAGAFGKVVEATAYGLGEEDSVKTVAVKMLKPSAHSVEREALMSELKILSHLGYHDNIVNLLGACTHGGPMLMITEYCYHGDLLNFLRGRASILDPEEWTTAYKNMDHSSRFRSDSGISCCEYQEMQPVTHPHHTHTPQGGETGSQTDSICLWDLLTFSHQVAQGMEFLSSRNCIHRDVAARNVLLTEFRVAKICDFGLARDIREDANYIIKGNARLPVKWMSPESIFQCVSTTQSDVWSYGVLLWEIFSLGKSPYPNVVVDTNFYKMIKSGRHMSQPDFAPPEIYQLMIGCWNLEPTHRPTFIVIGQLIKNLLSTNEEAVTQQNVSCPDVTRQQSGAAAQTLKPDTKEDLQHDIMEEAEPLVRMKMTKNVYQ